MADRCEINAVPCLTNDAPIEPYFLGRKGDPKVGFDWTYHFSFETLSPLFRNPVRNAIEKPRVYSVGVLRPRSDLSSSWSSA
jgi:branched-chain amino acid transport system substrate-binding protein